MKPSSLPFPWRRFLSDSKYVFVLCVVIALVISIVLGSMRHFLHNLVGAVCIGFTAYSIISIARLKLWGEDGKIHWPGFALVILLAVPLAQYIGNWLSGLILGRNAAPLGSLDMGRLAGMLMFTVMATSAACLFFYSRDRILRAEARAETVAREAVQSQLQMLQAQLEPHMLFNTLANLHGLIALDPPRAQQMLDQLIQYLRATLASSRTEASTLAQEFALLDAYLGLMAVRMGARLRYDLVLPEALRGAKIAPMLLQPLVENAIVHGLEPKIDGGSVHISAAQEGQDLVLTVLDNGLGLHIPATPGSGLGLANTRSRLAALFAGQASLTLDPAVGGGASARLRFPLSPP